MEEKLPLSEEGIQLLVKNCQEGDKEAFEPIFNLYIEKIFRYMLFRIGGDKETAKDLASDTFVEVFMSLKNYKPQKNIRFSSWLYAIASHILGDYLRRRKKSLEVPAIPELWKFMADGKTSELKQLIGEEHEEKVTKNVNQLPKIQKEAIILRFFEESNYSEIAKILGKSEGNVRIITHRGIKNLKILLEND
ncbi:MAG: RNA polymerase sigma factor [Patescibacteria group bacterium]|nr:RNA polymerase sigma factor [Patescibacteria group bacterium]